MACLAICRNGFNAAQACFRITPKMFLFNRTSSQLQTQHVSRHRLHLGSQKFGRPPIKSSRKPLPFKQTSEAIKGLWLLSIPVAAFCLGTWQVRRLRWKLNLIEDMETRTTADPIPLPSNFDDLQELEYRKVKVKGHFDHSQELYIRPRSFIDSKQKTSNAGRPQMGAFVVTPFVLADSGIRILVNRGWVPPNRVDPRARQGGQIQGEIEMCAVVRHTEVRAQMATKNDVANNYWTTRDVPAMSEILHTTQVFLDADIASSAPGGPIGGQTRVALRNDHLSYIFTWYILGAFTSYMWYTRFLSRVR